MKARILSLLLLIGLIVPLHSQEIAFEVEHFPKEAEFGSFMLVVATLRYPIGHEVRSIEAPRDWKELTATPASTPSLDASTQTETRRYAIQVLTRPEFLLLPILAELHRKKDGATLHVLSEEVRVPVSSTLSGHPSILDPFRESKARRDESEAYKFGLMLLGILLLMFLLLLRSSAEPPHPRDDARGRIKHWYDEVRALPTGRMVPADILGGLRDQTRRLVRDSRADTPPTASDALRAEALNRHKDLKRVLECFNHYTWSDDSITREELLPWCDTLVRLEQELREEHSGPQSQGSLDEQPLP